MNLINSNTATFVRDATLRLTAPLLFNAIANLGILTQANFNPVVYRAAVRERIKFLFEAEDFEFGENTGIDVKWFAADAATPNLIITEELLSQFSDYNDLLKQKNSGITTLKGLPEILNRNFRTRLAEMSAINNEVFESMLGDGDWLVEKVDPLVDAHFQTYGIDFQDAPENAIVVELSTTTSELEQHIETSYEDVAEPAFDAKQIAQFLVQSVLAEQIVVEEMTEATEQDFNEDPQIIQEDLSIDEVVVPAENPDATENVEEVAKNSDFIHDNIADLNEMTTEEQEKWAAATGNEPEIAERVEPETTEDEELAQIQALYDQEAAEKNALLAHAVDAGLDINVPIADITSETMEITIHETVAPVPVVIETPIKTAEPVAAEFKKGNKAGTIDANVAKMVEKNLAAYMPRQNKKKAVRQHEEDNGELNPLPASYLKLGVIPVFPQGFWEITNSMEKKRFNSLQESSKKGDGRAKQLLENYTDNSGKISRGLFYTSVDNQLFSVNRHMANFPSSFKIPCTDVQGKVANGHYKSISVPFIIETEVSRIGKSELFASMKATEDAFIHVWEPILVSAHNFTEISKAAVKCAAGKLVNMGVYNDSSRRTWMVFHNPSSLPKIINL